MGKKSREKKQRRELGQGVEQGIVVSRDSGIARFFLIIIRYGVYLTMLTPLIVSGKFYFPFVGPKSLYFMALAQVIIFSWLGLIFVSKKYRPKFSAFSFILLSLFVVLVLSAIFGVSPANSFWSKFERMTGILMWSHLIGFFFVVVSVFKRQGKESWQKLLAISLFVAVIASYLSLFGKGGSTRGGATIGNTSFLGTYLLFNVFWAIYLFFKSKKWLKVYPLLCFLIISIALYFSSARAALLCFYGGLFLLGLLYLSFKPKIQAIRTIGKIILILCILASVVGIVSMFSPKSFVRERFVQEATQSRLVNWEKAWKGFKEKPLLGWGPENFELVFAKYYNPCMSLDECGGEIWFDRSHNIIFDTLATSGILGLLAYLMVFISAIYFSFRRYLKQEIDFWSFAIPSVILIAYFIQNLTVFDMISSYLMLFLVLAFVGGLEKTKPIEQGIETAKTNYSFHKIAFILLGIIFCFTFFYFVIQPARAGTYVIDALTADGSDLRIEFYEKAVDASPMGRFQIREFFAQRSRTLFQNEIDGVPKEIAERELGFVIDMLKDTMREYPLDFRSALQTSQIYSLLAFVNIEYAKNAETTAIEAIKLSPTNQQGYWALAQSKVHQGDIQSALNITQQAIALEQRVFQSYEIAIKVAKLSGNQELVEAIVQEALQINPNWQTIFSEMLAQ